MNKLTAWTMGVILLLLILAIPRGIIRFVLLVLVGAPALIFLISRYS